MDVKLDYLQINQCPGPFNQANAFKNTAKCHFKSTYVSLKNLMNCLCVV